jgi:hypothetical protein
LAGTDLTGVNLNGVWAERNIYAETTMPDGTIKTGTD